MDQKPPIEPKKSDLAGPTGGQLTAKQGRKVRTTLRGALPRWQSMAFGLLCLAVVGGLWWYLTSGDIVENRRYSPSILPSPAETFGDFHSLWFDRELSRNIYASLRRVTLGFGLAVLIGVPLGVLCGCFPRLGAFFSPLMIVGRNVPIAALIPLTFAFFGIEERQKVMFIFIACAPFIVGDTLAAVNDVSSRYLDTAFTLGANRRQVIVKVLFPLAMPSVFNSLRILFGLAFGYIMLAELVTSGDKAGGLGFIINVSQHRGPQTHIYLILMIIPLVALAIDRLLFWVQRELFPYQYGGYGILRRAIGAVLRGWEDLMRAVLSPLGLLPEDKIIAAPTQSSKTTAEHKVG
jgi:ABC-type nitrate/sulfonate/bicarbonate transport system permease component